MASFQSTTNPTPFAVFDTEKDFVIDANAMVTFVKRKLGDDILSVELTNRQIWMSFLFGMCRSLTSPIHISLEA